MKLVRMNFGPVEKLYFSMFKYILSVTVIDFISNV